MDRINEDFNKSKETRATGFMGKNSEITWLQRLRTESSGSPPWEGSQQPSDRSLSPHTETHRGPVSDSTYHCDDLAIRPPGPVDTFALPPKHIADALFHSYLETVHPSFPILGKMTFTAQYSTIYDSNNVQLAHSWLAILNLVFAIGARYARLTQVDLGDHLLYFSRARILGFNGDTIFGHAELQRVQVAGLMAFYFVATSQISR